MQSSADPEFIREAGFRRVERADSFAKRLVLVTLAALGLAIVKPWAVVEPPQPRVARSDAVAATSAPDPAMPAGSAVDRAAAIAAARDSPDPYAIPCANSPYWLLVTLEHDGTNVVRGWYVIDAAPSLVGLPPPATDPIRVVTSDLMAIGLCPPTASGDPPGVTLIGAWPATRGGSPPSAEVRVASIRAPASGTATLYGHARVGSGADTGWPAGQYVLEALDPRLNPDRVVWVAVDVVAPGNRG